MTNNDQKRRSAKQRKERYMLKNRERVNLLNRESWKVRYRRYKRMVLEHYGGSPPKCACCGESIYAFLTIDHINGGGRKDRTKRGTSHFFKMLINEGYPVGFRVLCYNCNCAMQYNHTCPHHSEILQERDGRDPLILTVDASKLTGRANYPPR